MYLKFLVIEPDYKIRTLLKKNFEENFGAEVIDSDNVGDALDCLDNDAEIHCIITRNEFEKEKYAHVFLNYLYDHPNKTPLIVLGEFEHTFKKYALITGKVRIEEINRLILKALKLKKEDFAFVKLPDYLPYPLPYFYLMKSTPVDLYIRIAKSTGDEFVKRFKEGDGFTKEDILKYEELGLSDFFVLKEEAPLLMNALLTQTFTEIKEADAVKKVDLLENTFSISTDMMRKVGITNEAKAIADQTIVHISASVSSKDKLGELLKKILDDQMSFAYRRSYLISLLSASILPKLDWVNGEQRQVILLKLTMVAYFHDLFLEEDDHLKVMSVDDLKKISPDLTSTQKENILNHANKAAFLLQSYPKLPSGVDLIVKQHHGVSNGVGFAEQFSASISPLAMVFIVVEDFANQILIAEKLDINAIIEYLQAKYTLPSYRKIVQELAELNKGSK